MNRPLLRRPTHPGLILREDSLPALGLTAAEVAEKLKITEELFSEMLDGLKDIPSEIAHKLEELGIGNADLLLRMQTAHTEWQPPNSAKQPTP